MKVARDENVEIADGYLKVGDQLPTEDNLIERFEVSRITVRRAVQSAIFFFDVSLPLGVLRP